MEPSKRAERGEGLLEEKELGEESTLYQAWECLGTQEASSGMKELESIS